MLGKDVAQRTQIPLTLAFGITIHKSQGMSLSHVKIVCTDIFAPGQLAVALGRATCVDGLWVTCFDSSKHVIPPSKSVTEFLKEPDSPVQKSLQCCVDSASYEVEVCWDDIDSRNIQILLELQERDIECEVDTDDSSDIGEEELNDRIAACCGMIFLFYALTIPILML